MATYSEKLKDPRWQKMRLEVLERDGWKCRNCEDAESTLHVHHTFYEFGKDPWDYSPHTLMSLCEDCHEYAEWLRHWFRQFACQSEIGVQTSVRDLLIGIEMSYRMEHHSDVAGLLVDILKAVRLRDMNAMGQMVQSLLEIKTYD